MLSGQISTGNTGDEGAGFRVNEGYHPSKMSWKPCQHSEVDFSSPEITLKQKIRLWEEFKAKTLMPDEVSKSAFGVASLKELSDKSDISPDAKAQQHWRTKYDIYVERIKLLKDEAADDEYTLNPDSEIDFQQFILSAPEVRKGNLVLMDNGNLRAIWKDKQGTHLGLQFLGGGMVQYVIFKQREQGYQISRVAGRDTLEGLKPQIDTFGLHSLLYE